MSLAASYRSLHRSARPDPPGRSGTLVTVCLGVGLATLGSTVVNIALPRVGQSVHTGLTGLQWVANSYQVIYAALLIPIGGLTDRVGRRGLFLGGTAVLVIGSACCAVAPDLVLLLAGRVVQAAGAAGMVPATLAVIPAEFPDRRRRARAIGLWAGAASVGMAAGPLAGGVILDLADWRAVFTLVALAGAVMVGVGWRMIGPARHGRAPKAGSADPGGAAAVTVFLAALSFALIEGQPAGWSSPGVLTAFSVAASSLAAFIGLEHVREGRGSEPLMPLKAWRIPRFVAANVGGISYGIALTGLLFYLSLFLQQVQGRSALDAGLVFLPLTGAMAVTGPFAGALTARYGLRTMAVAGMATAAAGVLLMAVIGPGESTASLAWRLAMAGVGMGMTSIPLSAWIAARTAIIMTRRAKDVPTHAGLQWRDGAAMALDHPGLHRLRGNATGPKLSGGLLGTQARACPRWRL